MRTVLVTGGAGFIGANFVDHWLAAYEQDRVIDLDLLTYAGDPQTLREIEGRWTARHTFIRGDIADATLVRDVFARYHPDLIVNFAAESHNSRAILEPARFVVTNAVGVQTLLHAALDAGVQRFHHVSTCEVYGDLPLDSTATFNEESPYRPNTPYSASKASGDHIVRAYFHTYGLPVTISNCCNNYGPYQHPEKVIPLFTTNALDDAPLPLYRSSAHRREWLHVSDHCRAIEAILLRGRSGETYNVGSGDERSIEQLAESVLSELAKPMALKTYVNDRPGHDRRYLLDHTKIEHELGWAPAVSFEDGLRATVKWYRERRDWWESKKQGVDETKWAARRTADA